jgi:hypothetical protein
MVTDPRNVIVVLVVYTYIIFFRAKAASRANQ